ncbi:MAG TPA: hypothetical protein VHF50_00425 [Solirubrobacterales bacterium]|nr:hypothetical protein [Solirubrobacterales bacterium]
MTAQRRRMGLGETPPLPDKVIAIHEALRSARIPHAIGGALALAYYAEPRATIDIDVNLFIPASTWRRAVDALVEIGVEADDLDASALERDGQCRLWWGDNPVDLFFAYAPIHDEMKKEVRRVPFSGIALPILSPEHLAICKATFDRQKDWLDIEKMLIAGDLKLDEVESWLKRMVGANDPRLGRLEALRAEQAALSR